jgi:hypothetical protein
MKLRPLIPALLFLSAATATILFSLWVTVQAFAPRLAALMRETEHLPEVTIAVVLAAAVSVLLKNILD